LLIIGAIFTMRFAWFSAMLGLAAFSSMGVFITRLVTRFAPILFETRPPGEEPNLAEEIAAPGVRRAEHIANGRLPARAGLGMRADEENSDDDDEVPQLRRDVQNLHLDGERHEANPVHVPQRPASGKNGSTRTEGRSRRRRRRFVHYDPMDEHVVFTHDMDADEVDDFFASGAAARLLKRHPDLRQELEDDPAYRAQDHSVYGGDQFRTDDDAWGGQLDDDYAIDYDQRLWEAKMREADRKLREADHKLQHVNILLTRSREALVGSTAIHKPAPVGVTPRTKTVPSEQGATACSSGPKKEKEKAPESDVEEMSMESFHATNPPAPSYHESVFTLRDVTKQPLNSGVRVSMGFISTRHAMKLYAFANDAKLPALKPVQLGDDLAFFPVPINSIPAIPIKKLRVPKKGELVVVNDKLNGKSSQATIDSLVNVTIGVEGTYTASTELGTCGTPVVSTLDGAVVGFHNRDGGFVAVTEQILEFFRGAGPTGLVKGVSPIGNAPASSASGAKQSRSKTAKGRFVTSKGYSGRYALAKK
jgi:hypothetical protein